MPPWKRGHIVLQMSIGRYVGRNMYVGLYVDRYLYVGRYVGQSVCRPNVSAQYLLTPLLDQYQTWCRGCPQWVYDPYLFSDHMFKGQETWLNIIKNSLLFPFYLWKGRGISFKFGWNQPTEPGEDFKIVFHDFILFAFYSSYLFMKEGNIIGTNFDILEPKNPKPSCVVEIGTVIQAFAMYFHIYSTWMNMIPVILLFVKFDWNWSHDYWEGVHDKSL